MDRAGLFDKYGTEQMRRWQIVPETRSFHEMWDGGDLSHGWCSTPLVQMSSRILGVTPATPGFEKISICPQLCDLAWAKGKVPTPRGDMEVSWALRDGKFALDVTVPDGTDAEVILPVSRFEKPVVTLDGKKIGTEVCVKAGVHHFEIADKKTLPSQAARAHLRIVLNSRVDSSGDGGGLRPRSAGDEVLEVSKTGPDA
jgi:hypothetical protein